MQHSLYAIEPERVLAAIEEFVTGSRASVSGDRFLATMLFIDIVGSAEGAAALGDAVWRDVLERYYAFVQRELGAFGGIEVDRAGDGLFAKFDGPTRTIRCALAIKDMAPQLGLDIRSGLHTGEVEIMGEKVGGTAVHIAARIMAHAAAGQVLVSHTVKDLVVGSGIAFRDLGVHSLRGIPGDWKLFAVDQTQGRPS